MEQEPEKLSLLVPIIDTVELEERLEKLIANYRDALKLVARLPTIGRCKTTIYSFDNPKRRWVIRPFVRIFVESHIRSKIRSIVRILRIEAIALTNNDNDHTKKLALWIKHLNDLRKTLAGWRSSYGLLTKAPLIPALLPILSAILTLLIGVDFSEPAALGNSVTRLAQSGGPPSIFAFLKLLAVLLSFGYMLFCILVVRFGFRCKRAIFSGGKTARDLFGRFLFRKIEKNERPEQWHQFPETNIYRSENELFETLRIAKRREFPLDLAANLFPYLALYTASFFSLQVLRSLSAGRRPAVWDLYTVTILWFFTVNYFYSALSHYRERVRNSEI